MAEARLGIRANAAQLGLLAGLNVLVGAMVGVERSVLPLVGERDFGIESKTLVLSFVVAFGGAKALANLAAGALAGARGRRYVLVAGWLLALPVPLLLALADRWSVVVAANVLLGASQGLTWSMTVLMKLDLAGPKRRGAVLGLNESAGYVGVAAAALATGALAGAYAPRTVIWVGAALVAAAGVATSLLLVRDTRPHVEREHSTLRRTIRRPTWTCAQAGFATNLNDALMWGLAPLYLAAHGASPASVGIVAAAYPAVWGFGQLGTGVLADRVGRRPLIIGGMLVQGGGLLLLLASGGAFAAALAAAVALGAGTALAYPALLAAVSDAAPPRERASAVAAYRFWRDAGLVAGALVAGIGADVFGAAAAIGAVAGVTIASGVVVAVARGCGWNGIGSRRKELAWPVTARS